MLKMGSKQTNPYARKISSVMIKCRASKPRHGRSRWIYYLPLRIYVPERHPTIARIFT
jgi:hypothetical protein